MVEPESKSELVAETQRVQRRSYGAAAVVALVGSLLVSGRAWWQGVAMLTYSGWLFWRAYHLPASIAEEHRGTEQVIEEEMLPAMSRCPNCTWVSRNRNAQTCPECGTALVRVGE